MDREAPDFVNFIKTYYEWLEQYENPASIARRIKDFSDVDAIPDEYFHFMRSEFMKNIPAAACDERLLTKNILDFYRARGTEKSYRMLFRILYAEDNISFYYPGRDMLRLSDGKWLVERSLKLVLTVDIDELSELVQIRGVESKVIGKNDRVISYLQDGVVVYELYYTNADGAFSPNEPIVNHQTGEIIGDVWEIMEYPGRWITTDGFLSWNKYLQDNNYYQEFSYQINSSKSLLDYKKVAYDLVHPAGTKVFGSVVTTDILDLTWEIEFDARLPAELGTIYRRNIQYEIIMGEIEQYGSIFQQPSPTAGVGTLTAHNRDHIMDWKNNDYCFQEGFHNLTIGNCDEVKWLKASEPTFTFTDSETYKALKLTNTNGGIFYVYVDEVVRSDLVHISTEYPNGETTNLTYKYYETL